MRLMTPAIWRANPQQARPGLDAEPERDARREGSARSSSTATKNDWDRTHSRVSTRRAAPNAGNGSAKYAIGTDGR